MPDSLGSTDPATTPHTPGTNVFLSVNPIMHVEVQIDDSIIMIADSSDQFPANKFLMHVYVPGVDETFSKAISAGCESVEQPIQKEGDPDRRGSFKDFAGNIWSIGTQL